VIIKNDDLVAATHGRGFWILDNITPLRQINANSTSADVFFAPQLTYRVRWNTNTDTPLPPDYTGGENPPDGAMIDYYLKSEASAPVTIEIRDASGKAIRKYSSEDRAENPDPKDVDIPMYWLRPVQRLSNAAGMHRFLWDMHLEPIKTIETSYPIAAVAHNTEPDKTSPWVMPGKYTVVLTVNGKSYTQPLTIQMDPRIKTPPAALQQQFTLSKQVYDSLIPVANAAAEATRVQEQITKLQASAAQTTASSALGAFSQKVDALVGGGGRRARPGAIDTLTAMRGALQTLLVVFQDADVAPTSQAAAAVPELTKAAPAMVSRWELFKQQQLLAINQQLRSAKLPEINPAEPDASTRGKAQNKDEE